MNLKNNAMGQWIQIVYLCIFASTWFLALLIIHYYPFFTHSPVTKIPLVAGLESMLLPEPLEQFTFLILMLLIPLLTCLTVGGLARRKFLCFRWKWFQSKLACFGIPLLFAASFIYPLYQSDFLSTVLGINPELVGTNSLKHIPLLVQHYPEIILSLFCLLALLGCTLYVNKVGPPNKMNRGYLVIIWGLFLIALLLQIGSFRQYNLNSFALMGSNQDYFNANIPTQNHFDIAIYSLAQVVGGKTLLVDLPSQYGLYAEIIAPLFKKIRLTVGTFTFFMAILQLASLCAVFFVLTKLIRISWLLLLTGLAFVFATFMTPYFLLNYHHEPYYPYWPIRFFWPAISILAFYLYSQKETIPRAIIISSIGAIATCWNMDSGLVITLAFGAFLVTKSAFFYFTSTANNKISKSNSFSPSKGLLMIGLHIMVTFVIILAMFGWLMAKSHSPLHFDWLFQYHKVFYNMGFMMLPLPRCFHPWMSVLGIYLLGIVVALRAWVDNPNQKKSNLIYFTSFLGLGLFVYYQGRSHILNLVTVCWPALFLMILMTDHLLRGIKLRLLPKIYLVIAAIPVGISFMYFSIFLFHVPNLGERLLTAFQEANIPTLPLTSLINSELNFIKKQTKNKYECLILSQRQGVYYAESQLVSPIKGPGLIEMILQSDLDTFIRSILAKRPKCIFVGIGVGKERKDLTVPIKISVYTEIDLSILQPYYEIAAKNPEETMLLLKPKPA